MDFKRFVDKGKDNVTTIETDKWAPHPEKKGMLKHVGMRTYGEVFKELEAHLKKMGLLPDEYFSPSYTLYHKDNEELPDFSEVICNVNYGGSEGIYLDIMLASYKENGPELIKFATGKTLSRDVEAYYKMSLISAECSMMLNGRGCSIRLGQDNLKIEVNRVDREVQKEVKNDNNKNVESIIADATIKSKANNLSKEVENDFVK